MAIQRLQGSEEKLEGVFYEFDNEGIPLGEGAMGRVYKGYRIIESSGEKIPVAIKCIFKDIPEHVIERARREASVRIDNKNLLRMYGFIEIISTSIINGSMINEKTYYVIMELLEGVTLHELLQGKVTDVYGNRHAALEDLRENLIKNKAVAIQGIMIDILNGLQELHEKGFLHRDIDPTNIMIDKEGNLKLIDFGICKKQNMLNTQDKGLTVAGVFMGKVDYASPELVIGDVVHQNASTDIYALGIMLFLLCTGHLPFTGTSNEILAAHLRKPVPIKEIDIKPYRKIVSKATAKLQKDRYQTAIEFKLSIEKLAFNVNKSHVRSDIAPDKSIVNLKKAYSLKSIMVIGISAIVALFIGVILNNSNTVSKKHVESDFVTQKNNKSFDYYMKQLDGLTLNSSQIYEIEEALEGYEWPDIEKYQSVKRHIQAIKHIQLRCIQSTDHNFSDLQKLHLLYMNDLSIEQRRTIEYILSQDEYAKNKWEKEKHSFVNLETVKEYFVKHKENE